MAQPRVTDYFTSKKKLNGRLPTKRRKVELSDNDLTLIEEKPKRSLHRAPLDHGAKIIEQCLPVPSTTKTRREPRNRIQKGTVSVISATNTKNQQKITDILTKSDNESNKLSVDNELDHAETSESQNESVFEKKDVTPRKQIKTNIRNEKKSHSHAQEDPVTHEQKDNTEASSKMLTTVTSKPERKGLHLHSQAENIEMVTLTEKPAEEQHVHSMISEMVDQSARLSPLPQPPRKGKKLTSELVKSRLTNVGKLEELKKQLHEIKRLKKEAEKEPPKLRQFKKIEIEVEQVSPVKSPIKLEKREVKIPAYERYHHLVTSPPPTLTLPFKYKVLSEMFRGMDTVVSMMHNRNESCTYSKLKSAVQSMTKRNFEKKNIGQIKTVYPEAYTFRQERVPMYGERLKDYQLTVEANLSQENVSETGKDNTKREVFTASHLLHRRQTFKHGLTSIVKQYHKDFLKKLDYPLNIPDSKLTRWHPQFPLDEVPDVEVAPLPEAPVVQKYETAKDVLNHTRGKVVEKVEKALESVAKAAEDDVKQNTEPKNKPTKSEDKAHKGIPLFLLQKIRAKEALRLEAALTRDPAEDKKSDMIAKLPDIIRTLRMYYIAEKKPAVPMESVIQTICESSKNSISLSDVENHVKLLLEIFPEWISLVEIKRGRYIKLDRNLDIQVLNKKIQSLIKNRK